MITHNVRFSRIPIINRYIVNAFSVGLLLLIIGCAGVKIETVSPKGKISQRRGDILTTDTLSSASQEVLRIIGQELKACQKNADSCQAILRTASGLSDEQRLSTLTELWLKIALDGDKKSPQLDDQTAVSWLQVMRYAYAYLFFSERKPSARAFENRQLQIRDYYNYALQQSVTRLYARYRAQIVHNQQLQTVNIDGWTIQTNLTSVALRPNDRPSELISAESINFSGIRNIYRRDGFGTDLIAIMPYDSAITTKRRGKRDFIKQTYLPITALVTFKGTSLHTVLTTNEINLTLFDPYKTSHTKILDQNVPISANFTANYGLWLARSGFAKQALVNLFGREGAITQAQLYLMQPYDPNKRIVIMLHGLASSPEAWINVTNELLGDKKLRENYQTWIVYYPTNAPIALNNYDIRQLIDYTLNSLDPKKIHATSKNITLIGHSMGGVISRLMVSDTQNILLDTAKKKINVDTPEKQQSFAKLEPYLVFKPIPEATSAIFLAAPHRGTPLANNKLARWVANLIYIPTNMLKRARAMGPLNDDHLPNLIKIPNSIDNLSDRNPFMRASATLPINPQVTYYSIIGNHTPKRALINSSDGIVPYSSSHLDKACAETVILSGHSVQETPEAIVEIRRILTNQLTNTLDCR